MPRHRREVKRSGVRGSCHGEGIDVLGTGKEPGVAGLYHGCYIDLTRRSGFADWVRREGERRWEGWERGLYSGGKAR